MKDLQNTPRVFIPNKGVHDYSDAESFGRLVFLTTGYINYFSTGLMARKMHDIMLDATPEDYWLVSSLPILNAIGCTILHERTGVLNLLLWHAEQQRYVKRTVDLTALEGGIG